MNEHDEGFLWSLTKSEQRQLERLARRYRMTVMEVVAMARERALLETDPAPGEGQRFEFDRPDFLTPDFFDEAAVPAPDANVDLLDAWAWSMRDAQNGRHLLDEHDDKAVAAGVHRNTVAWLRFWAKRSPNVEDRKWYAAQLADANAFLAKQRNIRLVKKETKS